MFRVKFLCRVIKTNLNVASFGFFVCELRLFADAEVLGTAWIAPWHGREVEMANY